MDPLLILLIGLLIVIGLIVFARAGAFLSLICAAVAVSFLSTAPVGPDGQTLFGWVPYIDRVTAAFGETAGKITLLIIMGALIGHCMTVSGSADRIVSSICRLFGQNRMPQALISGGFLLSIPVFYDATFYLLLPLAKSCYRQMRKHYLLFLLAIGFGATISHGIIPPTPGPLIVAQQMGIPLGNMMAVGLLVGILMVPCGLVIARIIDSFMPHVEINDPEVGNQSSLQNDQEPKDAELQDTNNIDSPQKRLPSLTAALTPIVLPVALIVIATVIQTMGKQGTIVWPESWIWLDKVISLIGSPVVALSLAGLSSVVVMARQANMTLWEVEQQVEKAIQTAGMIILITSAGGAFGSMLRVCGVGPRIEQLFSLDGSVSGLLILVLAFLSAAMIKTAQGSSTTAMITVSSIFASMGLTTQQLGFNLAYLGVVIGIGSMVTGWMNDSGFCIFSRMSGIREIDALKSWTVGLALLGCCGLIIVLILSQILPLQG